MAAHALLAACHEVDALEPIMKRNLAVLEDRAHFDREMAIAVVTSVMTRAMALAFKLCDVLEAPAMRANRPFWLEDCL